eukprot:CAMPEP_0174359214 /NCGR_PEP_ID=MMETSP0811_2-20130205/47193_1 /TAXON_ID=73025 ORGANISM="Eutreptiella gymnastica-like, Strain CCMP1594" /NCGR_SAMPLE_ID=MMETSP0811_2 /ASSEMBLY_ACC=CAM_ASM_000667 /LENGTH=91 /DNA_ID=CAMNT_0015493689 /DNA_START=299 /DNA_END=575 /DNA_ORIENTATION=-
MACMACGRMAYGRTSAKNLPSGGTSSIFPQLTLHFPPDVTIHASMQKGWNEVFDCQLQDSMQLFAGRVLDDAGQVPVQLCKFVTVSMIVGI